MEKLDKNLTKQEKAKIYRQRYYQKHKEEILRKNRERYNLKKNENIVEKEPIENTNEKGFISKLISKILFKKERK